MSGVRIKARSARVSVRLRNGCVLPDVQADICQECGERYYDMETMRRLEAAAHRDK